MFHPRSQPKPSPVHRHRADAVCRVLSGEPVDVVAAEVGVSPKLIEQWVKEYCRAGELRLRQMPDNWIERRLTAFEKLVPIASLVSVLLAVTLFVQGQRKEAADRARSDSQFRQERVRYAYNALDDKYIDYVKLCLDHPDLDVSDTPMTDPPPMTPDRRRRESMVISVLTSLLERAYLMYANPKDGFEQSQWTAWAAYTAAWAARDNFRAEWTASRGEYDGNFAAYVDGLIAKGKSAPSTRPVTTAP